MALAALNDTVSSVSSLSESSACSSDDEPLVRKQKKCSSSESQSEKSKQAVKRPDTIPTSVCNQEIPDKGNSEDESSDTSIHSSGKENSLADGKSPKRKKSSAMQKRGGTDDSKEMGKKHTSKKNEKQGDSRKLSNLKRYLKLCGIRVANYNKLFESDRSMKAKERKLESMLQDEGMEGRPTIQKCKKIRLQREEKQEIAELDLGCIITGGRRTRATPSHQNKPAEQRRPKYDFGELSVDSDCSDGEVKHDSYIDKEEFGGGKKRKVIESSSDGDSENDARMSLKRRKTTIDDTSDG